MSRTRLSLWYVVAYPTVAGLSLLLDVFPRFVGMALLRESRSAT